MDVSKENEVVEIYEKAGSWCYCTPYCTVHNNACLPPLCSKCGANKSSSAVSVVFHTQNSRHPEILQTNKTAFLMFSFCFSTIVPFRLPSFFELYELYVFDQSGLGRRLELREKGRRKTTLQEPQSEIKQWLASFLDRTSLLLSS